ncbi:ketopantoate reductase family protein [candidate division TA06 bacterium]|nr:ketopantoate reductase family protein [candidate division TA06 bacterium]
MNILIYGAGAVGSFFGGFLAKAGHRVSLLGRPWHLDRVREKGLQMTGSMGEYHIRDFSLYTRVEEIQELPELILLTVKPKDTETCAKEMSKFLKSSFPSLVKGEKKGDSALRTPNSAFGMPPILSIQNGLGNLEILSQYFSTSQLLAGRLITSVSISPGVVTVGASADDLLIGEVSQEKGIKRAKGIAALFTGCGIQSRAVRDIQKYLWSKMVFNTSLNGLASILEVTYGELLQSEETKEIIQKTVSEVYQVAKKKGIALEPKTVRSHLQLLFTKLMPTFNNHRPSMLLAIEAGKKTDIDFLNGAISRFGMEEGVGTPINDAIAQFLESIIRHAG